jgi:hypothetical protein
MNPSESEAHALNESSTTLRVGRPVGSLRPLAQTRSPALRAGSLAHPSTRSLRSLATNDITLGQVESREI